MKHRVEIKRVDLYTISINEKEWNSKYHIQELAPYDSLEEVSKRLAFSIMRWGSKEPFHEGFGNVAMFRNSEQIKHFVDGKCLKAKDYAKGIIVHILEEDDEFEYDVKLLK